eukprot:COSAG06_NODE_18_length_34640_cov_31.179989_9_plen_398_part_00
MTGVPTRGHDDLTAHSYLEYIKYISIHDQCDFRWYVASSRLAEPAELKTMLALLLLLLLPAPALPQHTGCVLDPATGTTCEACNNTDDPGSACHHATGCPGAWHACCWAQHCACTPKPCPPADPAPAPAPTPPIPRTPTKKHIDWYCGECDSRFISPGTRGDTYANLVDGIMPCCGGGCHPDGGPCWGLSINCTSGQIDVDRHNLSAYAPFLRSGRTVNVDLSGAAACCRSKTDCTILENKHALASQVLDIALLYNLSGFTMDWEFGQSFNWGGYNETMAFIAETLRPHGIGLGISINSNCEAGPGSSSDPSCNPAYRNTPWAAILTDMGTYEIGDQQPTWSRRGPGNSTCPPPYDSRATDPSVLQYCGAVQTTPSFTLVSLTISSAFVLSLSWQIS